MTYRPIIVRALALGADGAMWVGTDGGLARLDKDGHWQTYSKASTQGGLPDDSVRALALGADGSLWAGTAAAAWRGSTRTATGRPTARPAPRAACRTMSSRRWRSARTARCGPELGGGLARLDKDGHWRTYSKASTQGGLPDDSVLALALGADGSLWAGTVGGGLARLDKDGHWQTYSKASTQGGLPYDIVRALALGADGSLWAGTFGGGLARLDKDGHWQTYSKASTTGRPAGR